MCVYVLCACVCVCVCVVYVLCVHVCCMYVCVCMCVCVFFFGNMSRGWWCKCLSQGGFSRYYIGRCKARPGGIFKICSGVVGWGYVCPIRDKI